METQSIFFKGASMRQTKIRQIQDELDAGMKLIGYENFELNFDNDNPRVERIVSYKNDHKVVVFYLRNEDTFAMKIFDMTKGFSKTTANFSSMGLNDVRTILTMY